MRPDGTITSRCLRQLEQSQEGQGCLWSDSQSDVQYGYSGVYGLLPPFLSSREVLVSEGPGEIEGSQAMW